MNDYLPLRAEMRFHYKRIAIIVLVLVALSLWVFVYTHYYSLGLPGFGSKKIKKKTIDTIQDKIEEELSK